MARNNQSRPAYCFVLDVGGLGVAERNTMKRAGHQQASLDLVVLRVVLIDDEPRPVILRFAGQFAGGEMFRLAFTHDETDAAARQFWNASTCGQDNVDD